MLPNRPYQTKLIEDSRRSIMNGHKAVVLCVPTGAGKTHCAASILSGAVEKGKKALFVANRRKLVHQCAAKLEAEGIPHGIIMRGEFSNDAPVQVCSVQTLESRYLREDGVWFKRELPPADLIFFDECHVSLSEGYDKLRQRYPNAIIIGLTATPVMGNGKGLGRVYTDIVYGPTVAELTKMGYLVPVEYYGASPLDLSGVKISSQSGEYDEDSLSSVMDNPKLVGDIVTNWQRICPERQTVVFASSVAHSRHVVEQFMAAGVKAEHIDAKTTDDDRVDIYRRVKSGETRILSNFGILVEGWDEPQVSCCILAQPTRNPGRYIQMGGRVLRPHPSKTNAIVIDHAGNVSRHGFLDDDFEWSLNADETIQEREYKAKETDKKERQPHQCPKCKCISNARKCPRCGCEVQGHSEAVEYVDAELKRILKRNEPKVKKPDMRTKQDWYSQLVYVADVKGYNPGWIAHKFKAKFGVWPKGLARVPKSKGFLVSNLLR